MTLFDTADAFTETGPVRSCSDGPSARDGEDVIVATKFGMGEHAAEHFGAHGSRRYVRRAVEASLRRLGTDYIDLYQLHRPDPITPIEETLEAMSELVAEGKVRYLGSSNLSAWQVVDADWIALLGPAAVRVGPERVLAVQPCGRGRALVPACERLGVGILPHPLAYGLLTGKYNRGEAAPEGTRLARSDQRRLAGADWDRIEALHDVRGRPRHPAAHPRDRRPARPAGGRQRDLRGHPSRAGGRERGRATGAVRRRPRRPRRTPPGPAFSYTTFA